MDFLPVKKTENVITDFSLLLPVPVYLPAVPCYLTTVFWFSIPSAGIPGIGKYPRIMAEVLIKPVSPKASFLLVN